MDLIRYQLNQIGYRIQENNFEEAEMLLIKAFSDLGAMPHDVLPPPEWKRILRYAFASYYRSQNEALLASAFGTLDNSYTNKLDLVRFFINTISDCLQWGNATEAQLLLQKAYTEMKELRPGALLHAECKELLSDTLAVYNIKRDKALIATAFHALNHLGGLDHIEMLTLKHLL